MNAKVYNKIDRQTYRKIDRETYKHVKGWIIIKVLTLDVVSLSVHKTNHTNKIKTA